MKQKKGRRIEQQNEGFTLVELLVTIAVLAVVSASIFAIMVSGTQFFSNASVEVDMQAEAQLLKNQLNNLVTDTARGVGYDTTGKYGTKALLTVYGADTISYLGWKNATNTIYYLEKEATDIRLDAGAGGYEVSFTPNEMDAENWSVLAEHVSSFSCNDSRVDDDKHPVFTCELAFNYRTSNYETTHTITLRNKIGRFSDLDNAYGDIIYDSNRVTGIILKPYLADTFRGDSVAFTHQVQAIGHPDQSVIYSVLGNKSSATQISSDGVLKVGADETASTMTVICQSKQNSAISAMAIVNLSRVTDVIISAKTEPPVDDKYYFPGAHVVLEAKVEGNMISQERHKVTWEVSSNLTGGEQPQLLSTTDNSCTVYVGNHPDAVVTVKATSVLDPLVSGTYTLDVASEMMSGLHILARGGSTKVKRNGELQLDAYIDGSSDTSGYDLTWEIESDPTGGKVKIDSTGKVTADKDIPYNKAYNVANKNPIKVKLTAEKKDIVSPPITAALSISIDPVKINFSPGYAVIVQGNSSRVQMDVEGLNVDFNEVTVTKRPSVRGFSALKVNDTLVLGCTETTLKYADAAKVRTTLSYSGTVYAELAVYFRSRNIIVGSKGAYAPKPGDDIFPDSDKNGIPDATTSIDINGVTYTYVVNGASWYLVVNGQQYNYNAAGNNGIVYLPAATP